MHQLDDAHTIVDLLSFIIKITIFNILLHHLNDALS